MVDGFTLTAGAADTGGCMSITNGSPTVRNSMFFQCNATTAEARGGAVYAFGNPAPGPLFQNTSFILSFASEGAAVYVGGESELTVEGSFFQWGICPTATGRGGAVCAVQANVTMRDTEVQNSIVGFGGGALMVERGVATLDRVTVYNNTAGNFGGAFLLFGSEMTVARSNITGVSRSSSEPPPPPPPLLGLPTVPCTPAAAACHTRRSRR